MGPSPHLWFFLAKQRLLYQNCKSLCVPALICGFCIQNSAFSTRNTGLHVSQTSPVVLCMQYRVITPRITSLLGSQTSPMVFGIQNSDFSTRIASLYGSQPSSAVFAFKTATLQPELLVSMGPSPHLWFLHAKQRLLDQNHKSLWVADHTCRFVHAKQRD